MSQFIKIFDKYINVNHIIIIDIFHTSDKVKKCIIKIKDNEPISFKAINEDTKEMIQLIERFLYKNQIK